MLDRLIDFEISFLFFSNEKINIIIAAIVTAFLMFSLYHLPEKELLVFIVGALIIWKRVLLLKIKNAISLVKDNN